MSLERKTKQHINKHIDKISDLFYGRHRTDETRLLDEMKSQGNVYYNNKTGQFESNYNTKPGTQYSKALSYANTGVKNNEVFVDNLLKSKSFPIFLTNAGLNAKDVSTLVAYHIANPNRNRVLVNLIVSLLKMVFPELKLTININDYVEILKYMQTNKQQIKEKLERIKNNKNKLSQDFSKKLEKIHQEIDKLPIHSDNLDRIVETIIPGSIGISKSRRSSLAKNKFLQDNAKRFGITMKGPSLRGGKNNTRKRYKK